jgi:uncharacterized RDD family membrane protein YckC
MQIYVAIDDQKAGPFTLFQVEEKLRSGEFSDDQLAWYEGIDDWKPLRDLAAFESFFRIRDNQLEKERKRESAERAAAYRETRDAALPKTEVRPWTRFWARNLDFFFFLALCLAIFEGIRVAGWIDAPITRFMELFPVFLPLMHLLEAYFLSHWGTTAGKALVGIHITDSESRPLGFRAALRRSLGVYVLGVGCYLPFFSLLAMAFGFHSLRTKKRNFWDVAAESYVQHNPLQARHVLIPLALVFLVFTLLSGPFDQIAAEQSKQFEALLKAIRGEQPEPL